MELRNKYCFFLAFFTIVFNSIGQSDTSKLSLPAFLQMVKQNHPLVKQANLITKNADANLLTSRGSFDPRLFYEFNDKYYDSKNYYQLGSGGVIIPTWFGVEFRAGYEQNQGVFLNPENTLPSEGLMYSQISFPLLQGLIIDERRATLKQAKLFQKLSEFEKTNIINELLYKAGKGYWDWQLCYANLQIYQNALKLSQVRFEAVKRTFVLGDRPAIDTVEAKIQMQDRVVNLQQALMEYRTKSLFISNYLWLENDIPIEITNKTIPESTTLEYEGENTLYSNVAKMDSILNIHPSLKVFDYTLEQLSIEKRFRQDKLKPNLDVNYNPLFDVDNFYSGYQNNYKWGLRVGFPIFLRKERGNLQLTKIKIENTTYESTNKRNELMNKTKATINEFNNYKSQILVFSSNLFNYERLWRSEKQLFDTGESSLFMINSREISYINAQIKLNEIINKNKKAALDVEYSFGVLNSIY